MNYELRTDVSTAETESGVTLLDERSGEYFSLNPTGALVLQTLLAGDTARDAVARLMATYDVDQRTAEADVGDLIAALESAGLVVGG